MILILDDNAQRLEGFCAAAPQLGDGWSARTARNTPAWVALAGEHLSGARLISHDHDLDPDDAGVAEPGTGGQVADWLLSALSRRPADRYKLLE